MAGPLGACGALLLIKTGLDRFRHDSFLCLTVGRGRGLPTGSRRSPFQFGEITEGRADAGAPVGAQCREFGVTLKEATAHVDLQGVTLIAHKVDGHPHR